MHLVEEGSGLLADLQIDNNGIELLAAQQTNSGWYFPAHFLRNGELIENLAEVIDCDRVRRHQERNPNCHDGQLPSFYIWKKS
jgi:hypothetical protein